MKIKRKKPFGKNGFNQYLKLKQLTMSDSTINGRGFQYRCSFCWRDLTDGGIRFDGIGACAVCLKLAKRLIDGLRRHRREYHAKFNKQFNSAAEVQI